MLLLIQKIPQFLLLDTIKIANANVILSDVVVIVQQKDTIYIQDFLAPTRWGGFRPRRP